MVGGAAAESADSFEGTFLGGASAVGLETSSTRVAHGDNQDFGGAEDVGGSEKVNWLLATMEQPEVVVNAEDILERLSGGVYAVRKAHRMVGTTHRMARTKTYRR